MTATANPFISPKARWMSAMSRTVIQTSGSARRGSGKALSGPVLQRLVPSPLDRRNDAHGFAIFGNGAAGDVEAFCPQQVHQRVVGQDFLRIFGCDQGLDMTLDGFGRNGLAAVAALDAAREEIFEFIEPACAGQVFIASDAAYRGFMQFDGFGHGLDRKSTRLNSSH